MSKRQALLRSESSNLDAEMIPPKTEGNLQKVTNNFGMDGMKTFFHPAGLTGVWTYWLPSSPGGKFENSPAVHCWVRMSNRISPEGTAESPNVLRQLLLSVQDKGSPEKSSTVPSGLWLLTT